MNVHPSLLPGTPHPTCSGCPRIYCVYSPYNETSSEFAGGMDLAVHQAVIDARRAETGCTVHYVTDQVAL
jgi:folate-dependent phosphoribosylglycinamide formyltransferase PurN